MNLYHKISVHAKKIYNEFLILTFAFHFFGYDTNTTSCKACLSHPRYDETHSRRWFLPHLIDDGHAPRCHRLRTNAWESRQL